ncbi:MAG: DUF1415 domain-containing protein [Ferruginibacter sp.]
MRTTFEVIDQTKKWINDVVVGCNFCPFAAQVMKQQKVNYQVESGATLASCMDAFLREVTRLNDDINIETTFLIFPDSFQDFDQYLDLVFIAEKVLKQNGYQGIYQLATFHPLYLFDKSKDSDAANYTNRSVYPMLHILREESIDKALEHYSSPESIPARNINFAREKGLTYMKMLRDACL